MREAGDRGAEVGLELSLVAPRPGRPPRRGDLHHAELRAVRAGGRAGAPAPGPARGRRSDRVTRRTVGRRRTRVPRRWRRGHRLGAPRGRGRPRRQPVADDAAARAAVPGARRGPGGLRLRGGAPSRRPITQAEQIIDAIEAQTGVEVVVYTQAMGRDDLTTDGAEADAAALMDEWGVGRAGINDGLVILFELDTSLAHGQVQLYAGDGFDSTYLSADERQAIFDDEMVPAAPGRRHRQRHPRRPRPRPADDVRGGGELDVTAGRPRTVAGTAVPGSGRWPRRLRLRRHPESRCRSSGPRPSSTASRRGPAPRSSSTPS